MYIKAKKKLVKKVMEIQNSKPVALLPKRIPVKAINPVMIEQSIVEPVVEKFRGYKVKQVSPYKIETCAPSRLF